MTKTTNAYNDLLNGKLNIETVDYETFDEIMKSWTKQLESHGGSKAAVTATAKRQQKQLINEDGKENFKANVDRWLNENE